jgi:Ca2+-binding EF-hand superfamily protein
VQCYDRDGVCDFNSLKAFFKRNGFYARPEDIKAVIHRLDIDYDGILNFQEFCKTILMFEVDTELLKTQNLASIYTTLNYKTDS